MVSVVDSQMEKMRTSLVDAYVRLGCAQGDYLIQQSKSPTETTSDSPTTPSPTSTSAPELLTAADLDSTFAEVQKFVDASDAKVVVVVVLPSARGRSDSGKKILWPRAKKGTAVVFHQATLASSAYPNKLSLLPSTEREMSTRHHAVMLCSWGLKAGMVHPLVDTCGWQVKLCDSSLARAIPEHFRDE